VNFRVEPYGPNALLVRFQNPDPDAAFRLTQALLRDLETHPLQGLIETTSGFHTLLLEFDPAVSPSPDSLASFLHQRPAPTPSDHTPRRIVDIPVSYDGPDLGRVAAQRGLSPQEVIALHAAPVYRVQILGFSPGFPYLTGLDPKLHVPRMATPRAKVPAGSVAIGGEHTGIYPVATAGGWHLIGRTTVELMDLNRAAHEDPAAFLLHPGDGVRFVPVMSPPEPPASPAPPQPPPTS
jgi:KipI family sensor histidine kinase inhibitor